MSLILADTSIWVDHLGRGDPVMAALLDAKRVVMHPYVLGEIAMGSLRHRARLIADLHSLPQAPLVRPDELIALIERHALFGRGIGYVDAHLLASTLLMPDARLWTRDRRLEEAARQSGVGARPMN